MDEFTTWDRERFKALATAWGCAWLAAHTDGECAERLALLARWAASYALDGLGIREERHGVTEETVAVESREALL